MSSKPWEVQKAIRDYLVSSYISPSHARYRLSDIVLLNHYSSINARHAEWAKEAMLRAWFEHANSGGSVARSKVKVDFSDLAC